MGESSVVMVKTPSNLRSGYGAVMEAEMRVRTLLFSTLNTYPWSIKRMKLHTSSSPIVRLQRRIHRPMICVLAGMHPARARLVLCFREVLGR